MTPPRPQRTCRWQRVLPLIAAAALLWTGCPERRPAPARQEVKPPGGVAKPCPAEAPAPPTLPFSRPVHSLVDYWLERTVEPDKVVMDARQIEQHKLRMQAMVREDGLPGGRFELLALRITPRMLAERLKKIEEALREVVESGKWVTRDGRRADEALELTRRVLREVTPAHEIRIAHREADLRCFPLAQPLYERAWDEAFDMVQCSRLRPGEAVRVVGRGKRFLYVWSEYAEGWVAEDALSPPLEDEAARAFLGPDTFVVVLQDRVPVWSAPSGGALLGMLRMGTRLPADGLGSAAAAERRIAVTLPTPSGLSKAWVDRGDGVSPGYPPLTRAGVLRRAFSLLNSTYGWGDIGGTRDCSRFMMDLFGAFGLLLPRNSWMQSQAGVESVDVSALDDAAKARAIEEAARRAVVLLYLKGHIMLYLGRDGDHLYALHQFSGYLVPCPGGGETMMRANRAVVSSLELGRGSTRKAFIQRISKLVLLGTVLRSY